MKHNLITFCLKYKENQVHFNHCLQKVSLLIHIGLLECGLVHY